MIEVERVAVAEILPLRELHRERMKCQIVHDSLHERGFTHPYLARLDGEPIGYGTVLGFGDDPKDTVDELFVRTEHLGRATAVFDAVVEASGATRLQAQTNDPLLMLMLFDHAEGLERDRILFEDGLTTELPAPGVAFRRLNDSDAEQTLGGRPVTEAGSHVLESAAGEVVAAGGALFHYNPPWGDVYMEVAEDHRGRGLGRYLVQELKRVCREMGNVPAARCGIDNVASRRTLQAAGMFPCGGIVTGTLRR